MVSHDHLRCLLFCYFSVTLSQTLYKSATIARIKNSRLIFERIAETLNIEVGRKAAAAEPRLSELICSAVLSNKV